MPRTLHKPAGLPVFPPHSDPTGACVLASLRAADPTVTAHDWPDGFEGGIAHRLDVPTSGALLCANTPAELAWIRSRFSEGHLSKTYRFLAAKQVPWREHLCDRPLAHDRRRKQRMIVQRGASTPHRGRWYPAHTTFRHLRDNLWEAVITTGVMHQIRVHAAFVGLPLLGDHLYGGGKVSAAEAGRTFCLHHVGLTDNDALRTAKVPLPKWARPGR